MKLAKQTISVLLQAACWILMFHFLGEAGGEGAIQALMIPPCLLVFSCCCECAHFKDDFDRADSTTIGADWTESVGDWSIASNKLTLASPSAGDLLRLTSHAPSGPGGGNGASEVLATISGGSSGDQPGLLISYTNATNYACVLLHFHSSTPQVIMRAVSGGVPTDTTAALSSLTPGSEHVLKIDNFSSGTPRTFIYVDDELIFSLTSQVAIYRVGCICGGGSGVMTWDDFKSRELQTGCTNIVYPQCSCCNANSVSQFEVTLSGFGNAGGCNCCSGINGTYLFDAIPVTGACEDFQDLASCPFPACSSGGSPINFRVYLYRLYADGVFDDNGCLFVVVVEVPQTGQRNYWLKHVDGQCTGTVHTLTPWNSDSLFGYCGARGSETVTVEGLAV